MRAARAAKEARRAPPQTQAHSQEGGAQGQAGRQEEGEEGGEEVREEGRKKGREEEDSPQEHPQEEIVRRRLCRGSSVGRRGRLLRSPGHTAYLVPSLPPWR